MMKKNSWAEIAQIKRRLKIKVDWFSANWTSFVVARTECRRQWQAGACFKSHTTYAYGTTEVAAWRALWREIKKRK